MSSHQRKLLLEELEAESIFIIREVFATARNPVLLYSIGKDSSVLYHIARKAISPSSFSVPLLHIDTTWKFREMYEFRDALVRNDNIKLHVYTNEQGISQNINPFSHGSALYTDVMKTQALKQAIDKFSFKEIICGARRDEEKSRAKERIFSLRNSSHKWDPRQQRPEMWNLYNTRYSKGETLRIFPLSNWTEQDIWSYIQKENIPVVPLYFAKERKVIRRNGVWIMLDDDRIRPENNEIPEVKKIRFRTLGCYPLSAAFESNASTVDEIIQELYFSPDSERTGRVIDRDQEYSMEKKKRDGYF